MVWGIFSWHTLGPLVPNKHSLKATAYLSIVADHVHPFMTTVYPSSDGYFQQDNASCHKAKIISDWFLEHDTEFTLLKWPPQSPDLNPIEHIWDVVEREICIMDVQPTNLQQLRDAIMPVWTKMFPAPCWIYATKNWGGSEGKRGVQPGTSKVYLIKWPVSVYVYIYMCMCIYIYIYIRAVKRLFTSKIKKIVSVIYVFLLYVCMLCIYKYTHMHVYIIANHCQSLYPQMEKTWNREPSQEWPAYTKITPRAQWRLIQEVIKEPWTTSKELQASLASIKFSVHDSKIRKRLGKNGIHGRVPRKMPLLTKKNTKARLTKNILIIPKTFG